MLVTSLLFAFAFIIFAHLAYDDWKELAVWEYELLGFFAPAWVYSTLMGYQTLGLAALIAVIVLLADAHSLFPMADGMALVSVILLAGTTLVAGLMILTLTFVDMVHRLKRCGFADRCSIPFITELFISFVIVKVGVMLV